MPWFGMWLISRVESIYATDDDVCPSREGAEADGQYVTDYGRLSWDRCGRPTRAGQPSFARGARSERLPGGARKAKKTLSVHLNARANFGSLTHEHMDAFLRECMTARIAQHDITVTGLKRKLLELGSQARAAAIEWLVC
jgi:hypothetical protein